MDKTYTDGLNDAWEMANKIADTLTTSERAKIFGYVVNGITVMDILRDFTPQEALAKLETYEKSKEINVGDVVEQNGHKFVIIFVNGEYVNGIDVDGRFSNISIKNCKKTNRHIDITSVLEQLKGE